MKAGATSLWIRLVSLIWGGIASTLVTLGELRRNTQLSEDKPPREPRAAERFIALMGVYCIAILDRAREARLRWMVALEGGGSRFRRVIIRVVLFAACAALLATGAYYRFHLITTEGIKEGDTVGYYTLAKRWASGNRTDFLGDQFYRPAVYWISELTIRWVGDNDYSISAVNGVFDIVNILLILLIGRHLTGSLLPGLTAGILYSLLPYEIAICRSGMPHAISGAFVLLALYFFRPRSRIHPPHILRLVYDAAAGFALGIAMNTHAELGFLGFGFVACQAIQTFSARYGVHSFAWFVLRAATITLGTLAPYAIGIYVFGYEKVHKVFSNEIGIGAFSPSYVEEAPLYRVPIDVLSVSSFYAYGARGWIPAFVAIPPVVWLLHRIFFRDRRYFAAYTPWLLVLSYMLIFPLIIGAFDRTHARIFLPVFPLTLIAAACALYQLAGTRPRYRSVLLLMIGAGAVLWFGPNAASGEGYFKNKILFRPSIYRATYDVVGKRVDKENRLLVMPSTAYLDSGFRLPLYFGENVEYLAQQKRTETYTPELLNRIVDQKNFSYFLLSGQIDLRVMDPKWATVFRNPPWLNGPAYDLVGEQSVITEFLAANRAHMIARLESADIYSKRKRPIFPNSMFEQGSLISWFVTGFEPMFGVSKNQPGSEISAFRIDTRLKIRYPADLPGNADTTGVLFCEPFTIEEDMIGVVLAGDADPESIHVALRVAGTERRIGPAGPNLAIAQWDVSAHRGEKAQLIVRDLNPDRNKGISVAGFYYVF